MSRSIKQRNLRLAREYKELLASPIINCSAQPFEEDIGIWHANIYVPSLEITFHFEIKYPANYPKKAPKVQNLTKIVHPNVFGSYICLDILTMSEETSNTPYRGWTSAYTISSLLVQLQSFLFEAMTEKNSSSYASREMTRSAATFVCSCGHSTHFPVPEIEHMEDGKKTAKESEMKKLEYFFLDECDNFVLSSLLEFVDQETLSKICFLMEDVAEVVDLVFAKRSYKCFYTLKTLEDAGIIFGLGAKKAIMARRSRKTGFKTEQLQQLHCSFDYLSLDAYNMGVRNNIWKDRDFDSFIPLYINRQHGRRSLPAAEECILTLWNDDKLATTHKMITAELILDTLTKLMNTTVVNMMKTVEDLEAGELQLFDSIKALGGYASMHHLLLAFCERYPKMKEVATDRVKRFISDPLNRDKERTPDVGELLVALAISDYTWDDFSPAWIEEAFIRNARWILAKYPNLFKMEKGASCVRLAQSFHATRTSQRLAMFQRFFISEVASPERLRGDPNKNKILLKEYNERLGMPPKGMAERLQVHSRKVIACDNWWDYFSCIDFCCPSAAHLSAWLRRSVEISNIKKYHNKSSIFHFSSSFITKSSDTHQLDLKHCICTGSLMKLPENYTPGKAVKAQLVQPSKVGVDICFVMDCTGSMSSILEVAKQRILEVVAEASKKFDGQDVRFAIVGYRDHDSPGYGKDSFVLKEFDFTSCTIEMQKNVKAFRVGGGGGAEAMCCAMAAAANMSWNRDANQIVILIGDQPPHGYTRYDSYPNGCPCGEDTLRVVHTMAKNGIRVYPVDCGHRCGDRQTFYHALARITGGYAFDIQDSHLLPELVVGACAEESMMEKLKKKVQPLYLECVKSHPLGRFEQHCQSVYAQCKAKKVNISSSLPDDSYSSCEEKQVDCMAFCMDIKQARAMCEKEYFGPINRKTKLTSYAKRPVSLAQVTKCMKRMKQDISEANFLEHGCQYLCSEKFSMDKFKIRWKDFKAKRNIKNFVPWNKLSHDKIQRYSHVPGKLAIKSNKLVTTRKDVITSKLIGKTVEVKLHGVWTKIRIIKLLRGGKVEVSYRDVHFSIDEQSEWRSPSSISSWSAPKEAEEPVGVSPILLSRIGFKEKVKPVVQRAPSQELNLFEELRKNLNAQNGIISPPSEEVEKDPVAQTPVTASPPVVQNTIINSPPTTEEVKESPVAQSAVIASPEEQRKNNTSSSSCCSSSRCSDSDSGNSRARAANSHKFVVGQLVTCRNEENEPWKHAVVGSISPLCVQFDKNGPLTSCRFIRVAQLAKFVTQRPTEMLSQPDDKCHNNFLGCFFASGTELVIYPELVNNFAYVIKPMECWVTYQNLSTLSAPIQPEPRLQSVQPEPRLEQPEPHPQPVQPEPRLESVQPAPLPAPIQSEPLPTSVQPESCPASNQSTQNLAEDSHVPQLTIAHVPENVSSKEIAEECMRHGVTPKSVRRFIRNGSVVAIVGFANHMDAKWILGLRRLKNFMPIMASQQYHDFLYGTLV